MDTQYEIGMIGLGVMGRNLVLNMADHGYAVVGYDKDTTKVQVMRTAAEGRDVRGAESLEAFIHLLRTVRWGLLLEPVAPPQGVGFGAPPEALVHAVGDHRELFGRHAEPPLGLTAGELAPDHHLLGAAHDAPLDQRIEPAGIEMVMMGDDGDVEPVAATRDEGGRSDVAERMGAEEIEASLRVDAANDRRQENRGHRPAEAPPDRQAVNHPVGHAFRIAFVAGQDEVDHGAPRGQVAEELALVGFAARRGLGIDPAVG